jgi:hypothetical protein
MLGATVTIHHLNHFNFTISLWAPDFRSVGGFLGHCALWPALVPCGQPPPKHTLLPATPPASPFTTPYCSFASISIFSVF